MLQMRVRLTREPYRLIRSVRADISVIGRTHGVYKSSRRIRVLGSLLSRYSFFSSLSLGPSAWSPSELEKILHSNFEMKRTGVDKT